MTEPDSVKGKCVECGNEFTFLRRGRTKKYCSPHCRYKHNPNRLISAKKYRDSHPKEVKERTQRWRATHKEHTKEYDRRWAEENRMWRKEYKAQYNAENKERIAESTHLRYLKNREYNIRCTMRWRGEHPKEWRAYINKKYREDPEFRFKERVRNEDRRRVKLGVIRMEDRCSICGSTKQLQIHHITYEKGGRSKVTTLCLPCHSVVTWELKSKRFDVPRRKPLI